MCDQCPFSEKIAEFEKSNPSSTTASMVAEPEVEEEAHWQVVDKKTGRSYLGSRSFPTQFEAEMMLNDLLRYHRETEWAERLVISPGKKLKPRKTQFAPDAKNLRGRPKGCKGKFFKPRLRATGVEWERHVKIK
jgi:hypothetical protein